VIPDVNGGVLHGSIGIAVTPSTSGAALVRMK
jgi:hypothetical protein